MKRLKQDARSRAVQAFWAMHAEALTWSGLSFANYASALRLCEKVCDVGANGWKLARWKSTGERGFIPASSRR